jgi:hypothetical protein
MYYCVADDLSYTYSSKTVRVHRSRESVDTANHTGSWKKMNRRSLAKYIVENVLPNRPEAGVWAQIRKIRKLDAAKVPPIIQTTAAAPAIPATLEENGMILGYIIQVKKTQPQANLDSIEIWEKAVPLFSKYIKRTAEELKSFYQKIRSLYPTEEELIHYIEERCCKQ